MPKFTIEIDSETHRILKERAKKDERSLTQYMQRILRQSAGTLIVDTNNSPLITSNDTSNDTSDNTSDNTSNSTINPQQKKNSVIGLTANHKEWNKEDDLW